MPLHCMEGTKVVTVNVNFFGVRPGTGSACRNLTSMPPTSTSIDTSSNSLATSLEGTDLSNLYRVIDRDK